MSYNNTKIMKLHSPKIETIFFLVFLFLLILPPFFLQTNSSPDFSLWTFPFGQMINFLLALFIWIFWKDSKNQKNEQDISSNKNLENPKLDSKTKRNIKIFDFLFNQIAPFLFCTCLLFAFGLIFKFISLSPHAEVLTKKVSFTKPNNFVSVIFCILNFAFSAFYEESVYRFYFPEILLNFLFKKINRKSAIILTEIICTLAFAFGHLYSGILSVINAIFAHLILRYCFWRSKNIYTGSAAHFIYNLLVLFLII